ncbi:MAG: hypothetical protein QOH62_279 [Solirubrobacteraceae bacterium]|jgi:integrase/recombinase XerD|nr:hypothetical protein [Solirubrobacteraceae bacterium]
MRCAGQTAHGLRVRALIVVLWRAALAESDLDRTTGRDSRVTGKGRREVGMDRWGWQQIEPWLDLRPALPVGALLCVMHGPTAGRPWSPAAARSTLRGLAVTAGSAGYRRPLLREDGRGGDRASWPANGDGQRRRAALK